MKKLVLFITILFLLISGSVGIYKSLIFQTIDVENNSQPNAGKILFDYVMDELDDSGKNHAEVTLGRSHAYEIDLNSDGINEIIGVVLSPYYCTSENCTLFILQKQNDKYKSIVSNLNFSGKIVVKRHLTNGYKDIELYVPNVKSGLQFKNGKYYWAYLLEKSWGVFLKKYYVYKVLDFAEKSDLNANKIVFDYIIQETGSTPAQLRALSPRLVQDAVSAFEIDLNDDGINEVIGFINSAYSLSVQGFNIYILQKSGDKYYDISGSLVFEPSFPLYILDKKTNGFQDIKFTGSVGLNFKSFINKFNGKEYEY